MNLRAGTMGAVRTVEKPVDSEFRQPFAQIGILRRSPLYLGNSAV